MYIYRSARGSARIAIHSHHIARVVQYLFHATLLDTLTCSLVYSKMKASSILRRKHQVYEQERIY